MYILGDSRNYISEISSLISKVVDSEQHVIENVAEIAAREPIVYACTAACSERMKCLIPYLNGNLPVIFVMNEWSDNELECIDSTIIQAALSARRQYWHKEIEKLSVLKDGAARDQRLEMLNQWVSSSSALHYCLSSSRAEFEDKFRVILQRTEPRKCTQQSLSTLTPKPPALHWSSLPQPDEAQITFKVTFPGSSFLGSELFELVKRTDSAYRWQYQYEWSYGVLFRMDAAKIAIIQHDRETLELSGRIDNAILDDDSEEVPVRTLWPYLSIAVTIALQYFNENSLQYMVHIIPFGDNFYEESNAPPRAFDLTQLLFSIDLLKRVAYRSAEHLYHLKLEQLFPDIKPRTVEEINAMRANTRENVKTKLTLKNSTTNLTLERLHPINRGRRVSFGAIRCIPQAPQKELSEKGQEERHYAKMLDEYVDQILNETMQQIEIR